MFVNLVRLNNSGIRAQGLIDGKEMQDLFEREETQGLFENPIKSENYKLLNEV